jgi:hypothetical protein
MRLAQVGVEHHSPNRVALAADDSTSAKFNVIYFERPADEGKVKTALTKAKIPYAIQKTATTGRPVNAVWIGVDIPSDVVERIGMSLLNERVDLRYFGFFFHPDTKTNIVQIGYSQANANNSSITSDDVLSFTKQFRDKQDALQKEKEEQHEAYEKMQKRLQQQLQQQQQRN